MKPLLLAFIPLCIFISVTLTPLYLQKREKYRKNEESTTMAIVDPTINSSDSKPEMTISSEMMTETTELQEVTTTKTPSQIESTAFISTTVVSTTSNDKLTTMKISTNVPLTTTTFALNPCFGFNCNAGEFCIEAPGPKCVGNVGFENVSDKTWAHCLKKSSMGNQERIYMYSSDSGSHYIVLEAIHIPKHYYIHTHGCENNPNCRASYKEKYDNIYHGLLGDVQYDQIWIIEQVPCQGPYFCPFWIKTKDGKRGWKSHGAGNYIQLSNFVDYDPLFKWYLNSI